jgi:hypothetical protein
MAHPVGVFYTQANGLSVTDTGDFIQLRGAAGVRIEVLEIRVSQTSDTTIAMNTIRLHRGTGGAAGTGLTEREWDIAGAAPAATGFSLPTTDVGTLDLDVHCGWNILQEFVWLPTPEFPLVLAASDHLGVSLLAADTLTMNASILWAEYGA